MREELKEPLGELIKGEIPQPYLESLEKFKSAPYLITVGDVVTENVVNLGLEPNVAIYDYKTEREAYMPKVEGKAIAMTVHNPPATITKALLNAIKKSVELIKRGREVHIKVCGEEDLATIPAVIYAPLGSLVIYGQPNEGVVLIKVTPEKKLRFAKLLRRMEVVYDGD
ncbi:GTP-dependent dephospho-CoA kinase family protein [Palaeococcus pacificus]|nr:GTP-dependent dephospho-CoA kinase family protein [Palaeococcus pacificus]